MAQSSAVNTRNVSPRVRALTSTDRDVTMFSGIAPWGPVHTAQVVVDFDDYVEKYGGFTTTGELPAQVQQFFLNGGRKAYINRIVHLSNYLTGRTLGSAAKATKNAQTAATAPTKGSVTGTATAPFSLAHGDTLIGNVDAVGNQTATISGTAAARESTNAETYTLADAQTLTVKIDRGAVQTVIFNTAEFVSIAAATAEEVAAVINAEIIGAHATVTSGGTKVTITSDRLGTGSYVEVTGGTGNVALDFNVAEVQGTGNVSNLAAVAISEIKTIVEAAWTNGGGVTVTDSSGHVKIEADTAGASGSVLVVSTSTADDELGLDNATHSGTDGTAVNTLTITGKYEGVRGNNLTYDVSAATNGVASCFNLTFYENGVQVEDVWSNLTMDSTLDDYVETVLNADSGSKLVTVTDMDAAGTATQRRPANATAQALTGGHDGLTSLDDNDFIGSATYGTGIHAFDELNIGDAQLMAIPDRPIAAVINAAVAYCVGTWKRTVVFVPDVPAGNSYSQAATFATNLTADENLDGLCWPRITVPNPSKSVYGQAATLTLATSGTLCGKFAQNTLDYKTDVFTQPMNEVYGRLSNVIGLENQDANKVAIRDYLAGYRVNAIVSGKDQRGTFGVWRNDSMGSDSAANFPSIGEARGVALIRSVILRYLETIRGTSNTESARLEDQQTIEAYLATQWLTKGVFTSSSASEAFYVNTDVKGKSINNPVEQRAERYTILVGLSTAPSRRFINLLITRDDRARDLYVQQLLAS